MDKKNLEQLLDRYFNGESTAAEEEELRARFRQSEIPAELQSVAALFRDLDRKREETTDADPFAKIEFESGTSPGAIQNNDHSSGEGTVGLPGRQLHRILRIAAGIILVLTGFSAGLLIKSGPVPQTDELMALRNDIEEMRNALIFGSFRQVSASERLSAVNRTASLQSGPLDDEITAILIHTVNNDKSVNVRLAAADALFRLRDQLRTGRALVDALSRQTDPLMQMALIGYLVEMNEQSAVIEMQKLLFATDTHELVRERLEIGIAELTT